MTPSEKLKKRILKMIADGTNLFRISKSAGVDRCTLKRWLNDESPRGMSVTAFDRLCEMIDWDLYPRRKKKE